MLFTASKYRYLTALVLGALLLGKTTSMASSDPSSDLNPIITPATTATESDLTDDTAILPELVTIGDPGNSPDSINTAGGVHEIYQIGKYEITTEQYASFLNAVATTEDPHHLYQQKMATDKNVASLICSTDFSSGSPVYHYTPISGREKFPITYVSLDSAKRYCNWLHNGHPSQESVSSQTTEMGAYNFAPGKFGKLSKGARYYLPSLDQWYKAAYYNGGSTNAQYSMYPMKEKNNIQQANYLVHGWWSNSYYNKTAPYLTTVDAFAPQGSYGVCDLVGNVKEWTINEPVLNRLTPSAPLVYLEGGSWQNDRDALASANNRGWDIFAGNSQLTNVSSFAGDATIGFRIVAPAFPIEQAVSPTQATASSQPTIDNSFNYDSSNSPVLRALDPTVPQQTIQNVIDWIAEVLGITAPIAAGLLFFLARAYHNNAASTKWANTVVDGSWNYGCLKYLVVDGYVPALISLTGIAFLSGIYGIYRCIAS